MCEQGRRGREGEIQQAFHSFPVGGGEHGNNAGRQDCGGHKEPTQSFLAKTNSLHPVQEDRTSVPAPSTGLGHVGGKEGNFGFLGVRSQGPDYLPSG